MFTLKYTIEEKRVIVEEWMSSGITMKESWRRERTTTLAREREEAIKEALMHFKMI